jgi:TonB family protein
MNSPLYKTFFLLLVLTGLTFTACSSTQKAQTPIPEVTPDPNGKVYDSMAELQSLDQMPELIGGIDAINKHLRYPEMAKKAGVEGRVYVSMIINEIGEPTNITVVRGIGQGCDREAIRVVKQASFKPGMKDEQPVRVQFALPVTFKLD